MASPKNNKIVKIPLGTAVRLWPIIHQLLYDNDIHSTRLTTNCLHDVRACVHSGWPMTDGRRLPGHAAAADRC